MYRVVCYTCQTNRDFKAFWEMNFSTEPQQSEQQPGHYFLHRIPSASDTWPPSLQEHVILREFNGNWFTFPLNSLTNLQLDVR